MPTQTTLQNIERIIGSLYLELRITQEQCQEQAIQLASVTQQLEALRQNKENPDGEGDIAAERG